MNKFHTNYSQRIAFVHHKGGTGKTTSCLNIAGWLRKLNQKVLVIDLDPQGNATAGLGVDINSVKTSITDVLLGKKSSEDAIHETHSGIYLIPSTLDLLDAETNLTNQSNSINVLSEKITGLDHHFNFILFDVPPGSGLLMMNSIVAAKNIIIALDAGIFGFETLETLKTLLLEIQQNEGIEINIMMALLKSFSSSWLDRGFTKNIKKWAEEFFSFNELQTCKICTIPFSRKIYQAQYYGLPISHYAPFAKVGRIYRKIAEEIIGGN